MEERMIRGQDRLRLEVRETFEPVRVKVVAARNR